MKVTWKDLYLSFNISALVSAKEGMGDGTSGDTVARNEWAKFMRSSRYLLGYLRMNYSRNFSLYYVRILAVVFYALYGGGVFYNLRLETSYVRRYAGALYWIIIGNIVIVTFGSGEMIFERNFVVELLRNGIVSPSVYCIAQFVASVPVNLMTSLVYFSIYFFMTNIGSGVEDFIYGVVMLFLIYMFQEAVMLIVSEVVKDALLGVISTVFLAGSECLFTGFFVPLNGVFVWLRWLGYVVPTKVSAILERVGVVFRMNTLPLHLLLLPSIYRAYSIDQIISFLLLSLSKNFFRSSISVFV